MARLGTPGQALAQRAAPIGTVLIAIAAFALMAAVASTAPRTWFAQSPDSVGGPYKVRPGKVYFSAGGGLFARSLRWRHWGDRVALGRGVALQRSCTPTCAEGG
jgi:hypothetical protein